MIIIHNDNDSYRWLRTTSSSPTVSGNVEWGNYGDENPRALLIAVCVGIIVPRVSESVQTASAYVPTTTAYVPTTIITLPIQEIVQ